MLIDKVVKSAVYVGFYGDKVLGIDYNVSMLPTYSGMNDVVANSVKYSWEVAKKEVLNKGGLKKGAKIGALSLWAYVALC